jgi:hypothetical protein
MATDATLAPTDGSIYDTLLSNQVVDPSLQSTDIYAINPTGSSFVPSPGPVTVDGTSSIGNAANPNPTGGWQTTALQIINAASKGFSTYVQGSPSVATPPALRPGTHPPSTAGAVASGNKFIMVAALVIGGILVLGLLAYVAK